MHESALLLGDAEELGRTVDEPRSERVRAAERLHDARHGHGPRRRAVRSDLVGRHSVYGNKRLARPVSPSNNDHYVALETAMRDPNFNAATELASMTQSSDVSAAERRDGRCDHDARGGAKRSSSPARTARCSASRWSTTSAWTWSRCTTRASFRTHPSGRLAQPGRRQPRVLEQLHRLPLGHGSARAGVRVLQLRRRRGHVQYTAPTRPDKYFNNNKTFPDGFVTPDDSGTTTGARDKTP